MINYLEVLHRYEKLIMEDPKYYDKLQVSYSKLCQWQDVDYSKRWDVLEED